MSEMENKLQSVMNRAVAENRVGGVNLLVHRNGKEIYLESGKADIENNKPLVRNSIFRLYSQTKPITAAAAMLLMERGELDLFQAVSDFFPNYRNMKVVGKDGRLEENNNQVLVWHLLNMTSGLLYPGNHNEAAKHSAVVFSDAIHRLNTDNEMTTIEFAERMGEGALAFVPGSSWEYGSSADVLGAVIEKITGKKLSVFLNEEFFKPLDMNDTAFYVPAEKQNRLAKVYETIYSSWPFGIKEFTESHLAINSAMDHAPAFESGGAGLASTLDDYMKFAEMLLNNGAYNGKQILKPATVRFFTTGELQSKQQEAFRGWVGLAGYSYANLLRVCKQPSMAGMLTGNGEYGWDGWLGVYFANFPEENMTFLMGTQKRDAGTMDLTRKLRNIVLSEG